MNTAWPTLAEAREWLRHGTGRGIRIAVLDSGVETSNPSLQGTSVPEDWAIVEQDGELNLFPGEGRDVYGHGTAIAGIIRQVAPEAEIGSFRVLGEQLRSRTAIICAGARHALARGFHILNCSFGCSREDQVMPYKDWVDEAYVRGRHVVAACNNLDFSRREWPGHFPTVITVNFTGTTDPDAHFYRPGHLVEFAASGQDIEVAWSGSGRKKVTGSSFAAPRIAGLLARLLSCCPTLRPLEAKALLQHLAAPWR
ncbi:MAG: S8 family serine peptidase [Verrucomicrobia subdivision 3 bacterium]|nr:S8 family serine peptidase [Limisphaerales bacterium]